jgi:thiol-disulfide isomerase/thioredoxin
MAYPRLLPAMMLLPCVAPATLSTPSTQPTQVADVREIDAGGIRKLLHDSHDLQLVTVWATWCAPCLVDMPETAEVAREFSGRGLKWTTISIDEPRNIGRVYEVLSAKKVSAANYVFTGDKLHDLATALDSADSKWDGSPPHTLLIAPGGKIVYRHIGPIDRNQLSVKIREQFKDH